MKLVEIKVRDVPPALKVKLKKLAKLNDRSMDKQCLWILKEAVK